MLDRQPRSFAPVPAIETTSGEVDIGLPQLLAFLRRWRRTIATATAACLALGVLYLAVTPPTYTASATLVIDPRKLAIFGSGNVLEDTSISNSAVETQVQVLQSGRIAHAVVDKLKLTQDTAFMSPPPSPMQLAERWIRAQVSALLGRNNRSSAAVVPSADVADRAAATLLGNLDVSRVGLSYAISVAYSATDPQQAMRLANAVAQAYLDDQVRAQVSAAERASAWLESRIADLQTRAADPTLSAQEKSANRATYDSFLERYTQTVQQQSLPFTDAQILTAATTPTRPTSPKKTIAILGAVLAGAVIGFGIGLARELLDRKVRTPEQVEAIAGVPCLGLLPIFDMKTRTMRRIGGRSKRPVDAAALRFSPGPDYSIALTAPLSLYAETLRSIKVAADGVPNGPVVVLGIISAMREEGRSTVAANLARLVAEAGSRVILIDGDLRNPTLSRVLAQPGSPGLAEIVGASAEIADIVWTDQSTSLHFIPAGSPPGHQPAKHALSEPTIKAVIGACRQRYDLVVVDLPAVVPVVDVRATAHLFDGFLLVVEWASATEDMLAHAVHAGMLQDKLIGAVLNKVDMRALRRHASGSRAAVSSGGSPHPYRHVA